MKSVKDIEKEVSERLLAAKAKFRAEKASLENYLKTAKEYGGFCTMEDAVSYLEISRQRISFLKQKGKFRDSEYGMSKADIQAFKKNRKTGRPKSHINSISK